MKGWLIGLVVACCTLWVTPASAGGGHFSYGVSVAIAGNDGAVRVGYYRPHHRYHHGKRYRHHRGYSRVYNYRYRPFAAGYPPYRYRGYCR